MATINDLTALTTATANDLLAIWDAEAGSGVEPTKKITAQNLINSLLKSDTVNGTTDSNGYLVTTIPDTVNIVSARCTTPACGCLPLKYNGVLYFMPVQFNNGNVEGFPGTSVSVVYFYTL